MGILNRTKAGIQAFSFAFNNLSKIEKTGQQYFYGFGSGLSSEFWSSSPNGWLKDYLEVPEINASINWKARACSNARLDIVSIKTGQPAPNTLPQARLIRSPNYFQKQKQFIRFTRLLYYIFGNEIIFANRPLGFSIKKASGLFSLPFNCIEYKFDNQKPYFLQTEYPKHEIFVKANGKKYPISLDECFVLCENNVTTENNKVFEGLSRIDGLTGPIKNLRASYEARNVMIENRGALGILTNAGSDAGGAIPLDPEEKEDLQEQFKKYGLTKKQHQFILTSLALKWQQISVDTDKLKLFEEATEDQRKVIDGLGLRQELFAREKGSTYENQIEAERAAYQDTIIPEFEEWTNGMNRFLNLEGTGYKLNATFDHLPCFQINKKEYSTALRLLVMALNEALEVRAISIEQYREMLSDFGVKGEFPTT
jgi:hypothetical protein